MTRKISLSIIACWLMCLLLSLFAGCSALAANNLQTGDLGDGFTWEYNTGTDTLTISGEGVMPEIDDEQYLAGGYWNDLVGDRFTTLVISDGVTQINDFFQRYAVNTLVIGKDLSSDNGIFHGGIIFRFYGDKKKVSQKIDMSFWSFA